jgi:hypothetical protein
MSQHLYHYFLKFPQCPMNLKSLLYQRNLRFPRCRTIRWFLTSRHQCPSCPKFRRFLRSRRFRLILMYRRRCWRFLTTRLCRPFPRSPMFLRFRHRC